MTGPPLRWLRYLLAAARLVLLYALFCCLLLFAGLTWQTVEFQRAFSLDPAAAAVALPFRGITAELEAAPPAERRARLAALQAEGYGWLRHRFDWGQLEPQPGQYDWRSADALLADIAAAGLEPLVVLDGSPGWARAPQDLAPNDNPLAPPADPATFARFAAAFAARYGDRVRFYQVWDEPNVAPHWGNRLIEPVAYAQLLIQASAAIRSADADAQVVAAALAPTVDRGHVAIDEAYFLQRMVAAGAADAFDIVAVQPFGFGHSPTYPRQASDVLDFQRAALIRRTLIDAGLGDKPLLAVRFGWNRSTPSPWSSVTAADQAAYAVAALDWGWREWPWLAGMGWAIERPAAPPTAPLWGFALAAPDGTPAAVADTLAGWMPPAGSVRGNPAGPLPVPVGTPWGVLPVWQAGVAVIVAMLLMSWRTWAAVSILPWRSMASHYRAAPAIVSIAAWSALLLTYYLATSPPLIGLCWIGWALLGLAQPQVGLGLAMALLPFYYQHKEVALIDGTLLAPPATVAALVLAPAVLVAIRQRRFRLMAPDWAVLALVGVSLLSAPSVWQWPAYWDGLVTLVITPIFIWFGVRVLAQDEDSLRKLACWLAAGGLLTALWGLAGWLQGAGVTVDDVRRLVGPHFSPNHTALYLERTLFVVLGLALAASRRRRRWLLTAAALVLAALALTGSRGAFAGMLAGMLVLLGLAIRRRPAIVRLLRMRRAAAIRLAGGAALIVLALAFWQWERLLDWQTMLLRGELWGAALALWAALPWAGVGPGGFFWRYPAFLPPGVVAEPNQLHPHNIWLELGTTWGLAGFAWLATLLWTTWRTWRRDAAYPASAYWLATGLAAGLTAGLIHGQTDAFFLLADIAGWNAAAWALLINLNRFAAISGAGYNQAMTSAQIRVAEPS